MAQDHVASKSILSLSYSEIQEILIKLFASKTNTITERFAFHRLYQHPGMPIKDYVSDLKNQANKCKFGSFMQEAVMDQLVLGIVDNNLRKRLLSTDDLTLEKPIEISIQHETTDKDSNCYS